jgi:hypothetical protein
MLTTLTSYTISFRAMHMHICAWMQWYVFFSGVANVRARMRTRTHMSLIVYVCALTRADAVSCCWYWLHQRHATRVHTMYVRVRSSVSFCGQPRRLWSVVKPAQ